MTPNQNTYQQQARDAKLAQNPIHTGLTRDVPSTPGYFRMLLAALPGRYLVRGLLDSQRAMDSVPTLQNKVDAQWNAVQEAIQNPQDAELTEKAVSGFRSTGRPFSANEHLKNGREYFTDNAAGKDFRDFKSETKSAFKNNILDRTYDNALGAGSLAITAAYETRVYKDIRDIFSETVAYETGKDPHKVTFSDLRHSNNAIVQDTLDRFYLKSIERVASDVGFFGKHLSHLSPKMEWANAIRFGDVMIGVKGAQLLNDITKKETSIFEDLTTLIDHKLNPSKGLGDAVTPSDMIDLYQKHAIKHQPEKAFRDATIQQHNDAIEWPQSEQIFFRIADLMNQTYKYKHSSLDDMSRRDNIFKPTVDFPLPKFIFLLGQGMIDPLQPEKTYAMVELAAHHSIEDVKMAKSQMEAGDTLDQIVKKYDLDITPVLEIRGKDNARDTYTNLQHGTPAPEQAPAMGAPSARIHTPHAIHETPDQPHHGNHLVQ